MVMSTKEDVLYPLSFMRMNRGLPKLSYEEMDPSLLPEPYQSLLVHEGDMTSRFRDHFVRHHGEIDLSLYNLIDGYFSLVMARNTTGLHQYARVLKGCQCLATAVNPQD